MPSQILTATLILLFPLALAANEKDIRDFDPLFDHDDTLNVELEGPFGWLTRERPDEEEVPGKFRFNADDGSTVELDVVIRTRGKNRRDKETCRFPPLRLNFKRSQTDDTLFDKQDKLKLVTHCRSNSERYDQAVVSEYLAYRILNTLTDRSFRARLLRIRYIYTDNDGIVETFGILIEHKDRLGKRINGKPLAVERVKVSDLRPADLNLTSVFQYFLGNTDFSPVATAPDEDCCHNQALFASEDGLYYTVPYDFDRTGWVNSPYATPNPRFNIRSVRVRLYRGRCVNNKHLNATLQLFRDRRSDIEGLLNAQRELSPGTRRYLLNFSRGFYDIIDNAKKFDKAIVNSCI
ncbi:MAG: hypothetical protein OER22_00480 [Gammaproteobacteria bacterium]|nr:hypothetical protein [Gammaproteobacteria bacterium]MDH3372396.1 hypothetical protein [Gammaproteobacteria bacterium]MDH3551069.1 hypothetical protein [Gammaproteobacteria bacterium]